MKILVPRFIDSFHIRAQELNLKKLLPFFRREGHTWETFVHGHPDPDVAVNPHVRIRRFMSPLPPRYASSDAPPVIAPVWLANRLFKWELPVRYLSEADGVFYPDARKPDIMGLRLRSLLGRKAPLIATMEGLVGNRDQEREFADVLGHEVILDRPNANAELIYDQAVHVIAISPVLKRFVETFMHKPCSVLPLGVDTVVFNAVNRREPRRPRIIGAGTINSRKRPEVFVRLAARFPEADFIWFGNGPLRRSIEEMIRREGIRNVRFPGTVSPGNLAQELRAASLFVLTSKSEGWGKVIQEAQACGIPAIAFGHYETPLITPGENGLIVWNEKELHEAVSHLLNDPDTRMFMGKKAAHMAKKYAWEKIAPEWEKKLLDIFMSCG